MKTLWFPVRFEENRIISRLTSVGIGLNGDSLLHPKL